MYFDWKGQPFVLACDNYKRVWENAKGISKTIEAMRSIARHGASQLLERAVSGFSALPPAGEEAERPPPPWWDVLGLAGAAGLTASGLGEIVANPEHLMRTPLLKMAESVYRIHAIDAHPDKGGSAEEMAALNGAIERAREELS